MGLWLGCSVLSIVELLELILDSLVLLCCKFRKRKPKVLEHSSQHTSAGSVSNFAHEFGGTNSFDDKHATVRKKLVLSSRRVHKPWYSGHKIKKNHKSCRYNNVEDKNNAILMMV